MFYSAEKKHSNSEYQEAIKAYLGLLEEKIPSKEKPIIYGRPLSCYASIGDYEIA